MTIERYTHAEIEAEFHPDSIEPQPSCPIVVYLFSQAGAEHGRVDHQLQYADHADQLEQYEETLAKIDDLGWINRTDKTIELTPTGVGIAGPLYSQVRKEKQNVESEPAA